MKMTPHKQRGREVKPASHCTRALSPGEHQKLGGDNLSDSRTLWDKEGGGTNNDYSRTKSVNRACLRRIGFTLVITSKRSSNTKSPLVRTDDHLGRVTH